MFETAYMRSAAFPSESVRPFLQVAAFGEACGAVGGFFVAGAGSFSLPRHLEEMGADGIEAVMPCQPAISVNGPEQIETGARAVHHRDRDRAIQGHHRIG